MKDAIVQAQRVGNVSPLNLMVKLDEKGNVVLTVDQLREMVRYANPNTPTAITAAPIGMLKAA